MTKKENYLENWKKERADFMNYKRDEAQRIEKAIKLANEKFILELLFILDNLLLAENNIPNEIKDNQWVGGIIKIKKQILDFLKNNGVREIESLHKKFDPYFHEVVGVIETESDSGIIIEEISKGYLLHEKVIRPSRVKIAK